jgi:seryl-tRNA(Sec) selenium transferase
LEKYIQEEAKYREEKRLLNRQIDKLQMEKQRLERDLNSEMQKKR